MKFVNASCVVCGQSILKNEPLIAYLRRDGGISAVDLEGDQPWSGLQCVCLDCIKYMNLIATNCPEYVQGMRDRPPAS